jgi:hypothetical protein
MNYEDYVILAGIIGGSSALICYTMIRISIDYESIHKNIRDELKKTNTNLERIANNLDEILKPKG